MFLDIFKQTVDNEQLFPRQGRVVLAVSGGADSLALLHACATQYGQSGCEFHVATLDHQLRAESADEVAFVRRTAHRLGLPCTVGRVDVQAYQTRYRSGLEDAARRARYDFLADVAQTQNAPVVATGHHADDQAETVLMRVLRGTGLTGLSAMRYRAPLPYHPALTLVRPLLDVRRTMIDAYCQAHQLEPRQDSSNTDTDIFRNAIRHEILPYLREFNPQIDVSLTRMADSLAVDDDYLRDRFRQTVRPVMQFEERVTLPLAAFRGWHPAMQRRAVREAVFYLGGEPGYEHLIAACEIARSGGVGAVAQFPGDARLRVGYERLFIEPPDLPLPDDAYLLLPDSDTVLTVNLPGKTDINGWQLQAVAADESESDAPLAYLNLPQSADVTLRGRQPGDRFAPLGMNGHTRSLKKWLIDRKIPQHLRDRLPLLLVNDVIAAVILPDEWAVSQSFAVSETSQRIIYFNVRKLL